VEFVVPTGTVGGYLQDLNAVIALPGVFDGDALGFQKAIRDREKLAGQTTVPIQMLLQ